MRRNNELQMMLDGEKPMAVFYRAVPERFDEKSGQPFDEFVKSGKIGRLTFYIKNKSQDFRIFYTVYTLRGEEWRAEMYKKSEEDGSKYLERGHASYRRFVVRVPKIVSILPFSPS